MEKAILPFYTSKTVSSSKVILHLDQMIAYHYEGVARSILGDDCHNAEKAELEGQRSLESLILGFILNTATFEISVPEVKIQGASDFILPDAFNEVCAPSEIKTHQVLRGLMTRWLNACLF